MKTKHTTLPNDLQYNYRNGLILMHNAKTLQRYNELQNEMHTIDVTKYDCFFAFSIEQFKAGKSKIRELKENEKIYRADGGLFGTKEGLDAYFAILNIILQKIKEECDPQEVYFYEFNNCECGISQEGDYSAIQQIANIWGEDAAAKIKRFRNFDEYTNRIKILQNEN